MSHYRTKIADYLGLVDASEDLHSFASSAIETSRLVIYEQRGRRLVPIVSLGVV